MHSHRSREAALEIEVILVRTTVKYTIASFKLKLATAGKAEEQTPPPLGTKVQELLK